MADLPYGGPCPNCGWAEEQVAAKDATIERMRRLLGEARDPVGRAIQYERTFASKETPTIREFRHILARIEAELAERSEELEGKP